MKPWSGIPTRLRIVLLAATGSLVLGLLELGAAVLRPSTDGPRGLILPAALVVLGLASWLIALPKLPLSGRIRRAPRFVVAVAGLVGGLMALYVCADFVSAFVDAGWAILADSVILLFALFGGLGSWCALTAAREVFGARSSIRH